MELRPIFNVTRKVSQIILFWTFLLTEMGLSIIFSVGAEQLFRRTNKISGAAEGPDLRKNLHF